MQNMEWIPIGSGVFPKEGEVVQVTYIDHYDHLPHCDMFAYYESGNWYLPDEENDVIIVEITAWKKNCKPYGTNSVGEITGMNMLIKFDRPIDKEKHYISPGGYIFKSSGKTYHFDFLTYEGTIDEKDPTVLHTDVYHLDEDYSNKLDDFDSAELEEIEEFFIYTGEENDPEIKPVSVISLIIEQGNIHTTVNKGILDKIKF